MRASRANSFHAEIYADRRSIQSSAAPSLCRSQVRKTDVGRGDRRRGPGAQRGELASRSFPASAGCRIE
jgi:hypothetical protein